MMNRTDATILVTGAAGFIGSHTILALLEDGFKVIAVDNCVNAVIGEQEVMPESLKRVEKLSGVKLIKFHLTDLTKIDDVRKMFKSHAGKVDAVIHLAALKAVGESCRIPLRYYENNILSTINLVTAMKEFGVSRFIFSSSATVYGEPEYLPLDENHPTGRKLTNPYGRTKYFIEEMLKDVVSSCNLAPQNNNCEFTVVSLRYFNPVGAHESGEIGEDPRGIPNNLMPFISQVAVGRRAKLAIFGDDFKTHDGTGVRDYIHICDLASGHVAAVHRILTHSDSQFEVFNLGSGKGHSVLEVSKGLKKSHFLLLLLVSLFVCTNFLPPFLAVAFAWSEFVTNRPGPGFGVKNSFFFRFLSLFLLLLLNLPFRLFIVHICTLPWLTCIELLTLDSSCEWLFVRKVHKGRAFDPARLANCLEFMNV